MEKFRAFIAGDFDEKTKVKLKQLQDNIKSYLINTKWVKPDYFHITFKFLGDIPKDKISHISGCIKKICEEIQPVEIIIRKAGIFPYRGNPRVLWVGIDENIDLNFIYRRIQEEMNKCGFPFEKKPFSPHVTLGRFKQKPPTKETLDRALRDTEGFFLRTVLKTLSFMKSDLTLGGPVYTPIEIFNLKIID
jgi:2'-5' RNA ligase